MQMLWCESSILRRRGSKWNESFISMNLIPRCSNWCIKLVDGSVLLITFFAHSCRFCSPKSSLIFAKNQNSVEWNEIIDGGEGSDNGFLLLIHVQCKKEQRSDLSARIHISRCLCGTFRWSHFWFSVFGRWVPHLPLLSISCRFTDWIFGEMPEHRAVL